jgi:hypothetical protein
MGSDLKLLAKKVFELTRRAKWLGGRTAYQYRNERKYCCDNWPAELEDIFSGGLIYWTLSPAIKLQQHEIRVCVTSKDSFRHDVYVFNDNQLKHPGGHYEEIDFLWFWWPWTSWSCRIAKQTRIDGGKTGPVDTRDLLLTEADAKLAEIGALSLTDKRIPTIKK